MPYELLAHLMTFGSNDYEEKNWRRK